MADAPPSVAEELKTKIEANKLITLPTKWCGLERNYEYSDLFQRPGTELMELFIPKEMYLPGATGFGQLNFMDHPNMAGWVEMYEQLVGELAHRVRAKYHPAAITWEIISRREDTSDLFIPKDDNSILSFNIKTYNEIVSKMQKKDCVGYRLRLAVNFAMQDEEGKNIVHVGENGEVGSEDTDEKSHNKQQPKAPPRQLRSIGDFLDKLLSDNREAMQKAAKRPKRANEAPLLRLASLDADEWRRMVVALTGQNRPVDDTYSNCYDKFSVWNPVNAFFPLADVQAVEKAGGAYIFCFPDEYETVIGGVRHLIFPVKSQVFRISHKSVMACDIKNRYFPQIPIPINSTTIERNSFIKNKAIDVNRLLKLDPRIRKRMKIGLNSHRNKLDDKEKENEDDDMNPRLGEDSDADEPVPAPGSMPEIIEGLDLLPSLADSISSYEKVVFQKQSAVVPTCDTDRFQEETIKLYKEGMAGIDQYALNPTWFRARQFLFSTYGLPKDAPESAIDSLPGDQGDGLLNKLRSIKFPKWEINPEWTKKRQELFISRFIDFETNVFTEDGAVPDSIKAMCIWARKHLRNDDGSENHLNFSMPAPQQTSNLDPFGDLMMSTMNELDGVSEIFTVHTHILLILFAAFQVYFDTPFHAHVAQVGPPKAGKSHTQKVVRLHLIDGTYVDLTYQSVKAKTGSGAINPFQLSHLIEFYEDIRPSALGAGTDETNDDLSIIKTLLTKGEMTFSVCVIGPDGTRENQTKTVKVNNLLVCAANISKWQMTPSLLSRTVAITYLNDERVDRGGAVSKIGETPKDKKKAQELSQYRWKRNQYFTAKTAYMIKCLSPYLELDTSEAEAVFSLVANEAVKEPYCLHGFDDVRKFEQLRFLTQPMAVVEGTHLAFDSVMSRVSKTKWHPMHFLEIIPHLKATTKHATLALGLMEQQFENQVETQVHKTLVTEIFTEPRRAPDAGPSHITGDHNVEEFMFPDVHIGQGVQQLDLNGKSKPKPKPKKDASLSSYSTSDPNRIKRCIIDGDYTVVKMEDVGMSATASNRRTGDEVLTRLANMLRCKMQPQPTVGDILHALKELTTTVVEKEFVEVTPNGKGASYSKKVPILEIDEFKHELRIMTSFTLSAVKVSRRLKECIQNTLSHTSARVANHLYGAPIENEPNVLEMVRITPSPHKNNLQLIDPNYFSSAIRKSIKRSLEAVTENKIEDQPPIPLNWDRMFSKRKRMLINVDLGDFFTAEFNRKTFMESSMYVDIDPKSKLPSNHPAEIARRFRERPGTNSLPKYPEAFRAKRFKASSSSSRSCSLMSDLMKRRNEINMEDPIEEVSESESDEDEGEEGAMRA